VPQFTSLNKLMLSFKISNLVVSVDIASAASHGMPWEFPISIMVLLSMAVSILSSCCSSVLLLIPSLSGTSFWCCELSTSPSQSSSPSELDGEHDGLCGGGVEMSSLER